MEYSRESQERMAKIEALKNADIIPYANNYRGKQDIDEIISQKDKVHDADELMENGAVGDFKTAGRLVGYRSFGKLSFGKIVDHKGEIQISFVKDKVSFNTGRKIIGNDEIITIDKIDRSPFKIIEKLVDVGDYVGVIGDLYITKHGELTLFVKEFQILSKAVRPLPEKFHGISDIETIYRQRYLDLITNQESYDRMNFRSKFITLIREFLKNNDFKELECPVLNNAASGAAAKPFISHHNDYGEDYFLRICNEISLKKATVGKFERVFDMGKCFRNEGSDPSHLQEFTMLEFQATWWTLEDNMKFAEKLIDYTFTKLNLDKNVMIKDKNGVEKEVDFTVPWERIDYIEGVNNASGLDITSYKQGDEKKLLEDIKAKGIQFEGMEVMGVTTLIDYLFKKVLRPSIVGPAFVYNYPKLMQPLARQSDKDVNVVEQYQVIVNGWETMKCYSELVDPQIMKENFNSQGEALERGDEEATSGDDDFVLAMEYGMPPQSGFGMGIDRIVSLITGQDNLRDSVLFPLMKSEKEILSKKEAEKRYREKKIVVIADESLHAGIVANAIGQLGISIGGHCKQKLFDANVLHDKDNNVHYTDGFYPMTNLTGNHQQMAEFAKLCYDNNIQFFDFSDIMRKAHTDDEMLKGYKEKSTEDIGYIAVGALVKSDFAKDFLSELKRFGD